MGMVFRTGVISSVKGRYLVASAPASLTPLQLPQLLTAAMPVTTAAAPPADVPAWFRRMDRNGDGDVSLREFLGPLELFRAIDRDGDGLISADEARAAEKVAPRLK